MSEKLTNSETPVFASAWNPGSSINGKHLVIAIVLIVAVYFLTMVIDFFKRFHFTGPTAWTTQPLPTGDYAVRESCIPCDCPPEPQMRSKFGSFCGAHVTGWPSTGGVLMGLHYGAVELEFLGLDRFEETPKAENQADEDAFCRRLKMMGAKWCRSSEIEDSLEFPKAWDEECLLLGWPEDGSVWVLKKTGYEASKEGLGRVGNAKTMAERCWVIQKLGGTFYRDPKDCPDTQDLV
jgi:hypothetical protein